MPLPRCCDLRQPREDLNTHPLQLAPQTRLSVEGAIERDYLPNAESTAPTSGYMSDEGDSPAPDPFPSGRTSQFPKHDGPRVWFLTEGCSPIAVALARQLLEHGDCVLAGTRRVPKAGEEEGGDDLSSLQAEVDEDTTSRSCFRIVAFDITSASQCQATIATAVEVFGHLDVLFCCGGEALIGSIEEVSESARTQSLIKNQFNSNFFGPVNIIKAALPTFRARQSGHIILLTGITGHLGTPGLGMYCASQWAIEGYCDSLAYEVAPFNIRMSIVQSSIEVSILTNKITSAPPLGPYAEAQNKAPLARVLWSRLLDTLDEACNDPSSHGGSSEAIARKKPSELLNSNKAAELYPRLPTEFKDSLIAETVYALAAIGGHSNPPARHIVGLEGIASVKEKLKTVSEELEDFFDVSNAVDL